MSPQDELVELARETIDELLRSMSAKERLKGLSADELLAAMSPEIRAALAQRLKEDGSPESPSVNDPGHGKGNK
jgi:hypothetical protein